MANYETQHKSDRNSSSDLCYDGASRIHDNRLGYNKHILQISSLYEFCPGFTNNNFNLVGCAVKFFKVCKPRLISNLTVHSLRAACRPGEWLWVDSNGKNAK